jgi:hypothetical protein
MKTNHTNTNFHERKITKPAIFISQPTISRLIKRMNYSIKTVVKIPVERNSPSNLSARQVYARYLNFIYDNNLD